MTTPLEAHRPLDIAAGLGEFDFHEFAPFNQSAFAVFRGTGPGAGPWEYHDDTDELLYALAGSVTIELLPPEGDSTLVPLVAGSLVVVPRRHWHRHVDAQDLVELYFTPGSSVDSMADDPRVG